MLGDVPLTPASILDLIAGAIDARVTPQNVPGSHSAARPEKERPMKTNLMVRCGLGRAVTPHDQWVGSMVMIGLTLLFGVMFVLAAYQYRDNELVDALGILAFPAAMILSMPFTQLKGHSRISQVVIVGSSLLLLVLAAILATKI